MAESERAPDGQDKIANFNLVAVANAGGQEIFAGDANHGHVCRRIGPDSGRFEEFSVVGANLDLVQRRRFDNVAIGQNVELILDLDDDA